MRADIHDGQGAKHSLQRAEYRCARSIISRSSHPACTARPVHTKYMVKRWGPPSQGWRIFLLNDALDIAVMNLFVVPTIGLDLLYAFVIVRQDRRTRNSAAVLGSGASRGRAPCDPVEHCDHVLDLGAIEPLRDKHDLATAVGVRPGVKPRQVM
jgi:hypothetical protein